VPRPDDPRPDDPRLGRGDATSDGTTTVEPGTGVPATPPQMPADEAQQASGRRTRPKRRKQKLGVVTWLALVWIFVVIAGAVLAAFLPLPAPNATNVSAMLQPPFESMDHPLGTDGLGRDLLSRVVFGARVSLIVAFVAVAIGSTVGGVVGLLVGYFRGKADTLVMGFVDVMLAFPGLVLLLTVIAFVGRTLTTISVTIGLLSIPIYTRVSRANTMAVASREFVLAAKAMGARTSRVLFREIAPNVALPLSAYALVTVGVIIVLEGALSFLGLSIDQPTPTWGGIINEGRRHLAVAPHISGVPSVVMFLTVISLNLVGDKLRTRFDVKGTNL
jgi:peptide/nickel transport system permease protein